MPIHRTAATVARPVPVLDEAPETPVAPVAATLDAYGFPRRAFDVTTVRPRARALAKALEGAGLPAESAVRLARMAKAEGLTTLAPGQTLRVYRDGARISHIVTEPDVRAYVVLRPGLLPVVTRQDRPVERTERLADLELAGSLERTVDRAGLDAEIADTLRALFGDRLSFDALARGTSVQVVLREATAAGALLSTDVLAVRVVTPKRTYEAYRFTGDEATRYYDAEGGRFEDLFLKTPVAHGMVTSAYSLNRFHPVQQIWKPHFGTDFAAPTGTPVMAMADGVVLEAGFGGGNGNYVKLQHDKTYTTGYLHFSRIAPGLRRGDRVERGQVIGFVGQTGLATGPHVCFRFWKNGQQVDFLKAKLPPALPLAAAERAEFRAERDRLRALLDGPSFAERFVAPLVLPAARLIPATEATV